MSNPLTAESIIDAMAEHDIAKGAEPITLKWKGSKVPRGHSVNGIQIGWTQHGLVTGVDGQNLGTYTRLQEFGGPDRDEHVMLIVPHQTNSQ